MVELKNGETFNGHLVNCDNFMNITLREVYQTSAEGDRFWKLKECYIRGSTVSNAHYTPCWISWTPRKLVGSVSVANTFEIMARDVGGCCYVLS